jgi:hypothetical protein
MTDLMIAYRAAEPEDVRSATLIARTADLRAHVADECGTRRAVMITHASVGPRTESELSGGETRARCTCDWRFRSIRSALVRRDSP